MKVRLGEVDFTTEDESEIQDRTIVEMIKHPKYSQEMKYNDIALLRLDAPVRFTAFVRPACLQTTKQVPPLAIATGFGKTSYGTVRPSSGFAAVTFRLFQTPWMEARS